MSLAGFDAMTLASLVDLDLRAEAATYTPPAGAAVDCQILFDDEAVDGVGEVARTVATRRVVRIQRAEVANPVRGGIVEWDSVQWRLESLFENDADLPAWVVTRVRA